MPDAQGSTRQLTNASGPVSARFAFDAYGVYLYAPVGVPNAPATKILYTGQLFDVALLTLPPVLDAILVNGNAIQIIHSVRRLPVGYNHGIAAFHGITFLAMMPESNSLLLQLGRNGPFQTDFAIWPIHLCEFFPRHTGCLVDCKGGPQAGGVSVQQPWYSRTTGASQGNTTVIGASNTRVSNSVTRIDGQSLEPTWGNGAANDGFVIVTPDTSNDPAFAIPNTDGPFTDPGFTILPPNDIGVPPATNDPPNLGLPVGTSGLGGLISSIANGGVGLAGHGNSMSKEYPTGQVAACHNIPDPKPSLGGATTTAQKLLDARRSAFRKVKSLGIHTWCDWNTSGMTEPRSVPLSCRAQKLTKERNQKLENT